MIIKKAKNVIEGDIINRAGNKLVVDLVRGSTIRYHRLKQQAGATVAGGMTSAADLQRQIDGQEATVERGN